MMVRIIFFSFFSLRVSLSLPYTTKLHVIIPQFTSYDRFLWPSPNGDTSTGLYVTVAKSLVLLERRCVESAGQDRGGNLAKKT